MMDPAYEEILAREELLKIAIRRLGSEREEPSAHFDAELEYCDDMMVDAARRLVAAREAAKAEVADVPGPSYERPSHSWDYLVGQNHGR